ncbi:dentin sialophosphoprotein-like [Penaeus monodon]|uniref:dentin sialophosphoprotein-like n=1 Tax=Penaeus monodon TaxID=6687 RepID=UPI0018A78985|nr:dentin sialophosphoprotein-like [Penaeus monodon]
MSTCEDSAVLATSSEEDADQTLVSADGISAGTSGAWDTGDSAAPDLSSKSDVINGNKSDVGDSSNKSDVINGNKSDVSDSNNKSDTNSGSKKSNLSSSSKSGASSSNKSNTSNGSSRPNLSSKSKADVNGTNKSGSSSLAKKKEAASVRVKKKPPLQVVQSRFKAAAAAAKKNSGNSSSGSRNGSNNSSSLGSPGSRNGCLNTTLVGGSSTSVAGNKGPTKGRPVRASMAPTASGPISRSTVNIAKTGVLPSRATNKSSPRTQVSQSATNLASHGSTGMTRPSKPMAVRANKHKLHSTVLNATVLGDKTHKEDSSNVFSTTLVGGMAPGGRNLDLTCATLPELPDISAIRLDSVGHENRSGDTTVLSSVSEKDSTQDSNDCSMHEVTAEELELEYLRYMQWAQVNLCSKSVFLDQIKDAETQIMFLEELISEKQNELSERRQMTELVVHHQHVAEARQNQTKLLQSLIDALPASEEGMQTMSRELEKSLHQVKMDNLYVPENHKQYRDQLSDSLTNQVSLLRDLESLLDTRSNHLQSTISLLGELQSTTHRIQQCENEVHKAARLSVQEASLQIGAKQTQENGTVSHGDDSFNLVISA